MKSSLHKFVFLFSLIISSCQVSIAQATSFQWAKSVEGTYQEYANAVVVDSFGCVYTTGTFSGTADFDPGIGTFNLTTNGQKDIFILKLDSSGHFLWVKQFGGTMNDQGNSIALDGGGNVYTTGYFNQTVDFDPGVGVFNLTTGGMFISKLDSSGNFVWAKQMAVTGISSGVFGCSIFIDVIGNIYTTGAFVDTVDFDPGAGTYNLISPPGGAISVFISKLDSSGNFVWAKQIEGTLNKIGNSIAVDGLGNVYVTGEFYGTADFDPGIGIFNLTSLGYVDIFVSKLDNSGNFKWAKSMSGTNNERGMSIAVDKAGNVYTTGHFHGSVDFDPGTGIYNLVGAQYNAFVSKLDSAGNFVWAKQFGEGSLWNVYSNSIALDTADNIYTAGMFQSTADFDPGVGVFSLTAGNWDIFVSKLDNSGNFKWAKSMGGTTDDRAYSVTVDKLNNVYTTGYFRTTADFDPGIGIFNLTSVGYDDLFIHKMSQCHQSFFTISTTQCDAYTLNGQTYTATGIYTQNLINSIACDSILTLNLTINALNSTVTQTGTTLTSNLSGAIYQWIKCENNVLIIGATNQSYSATSNGSYAVIITSNGCTDTSSCYTVTGVGIENYYYSNLINVSPNPTNGEINIKTLPSSGLKNASLKIINITGQIVFQQEHLNGNRFTFDISNHAKGLYILEIVDEGKTERVKIDVRN